MQPGEFMLHCLEIQGEGSCVSAVALHACWELVGSWNDASHVLHQPRRALGAVVTGMSWSPSLQPEEAKCTARV